MTDLNEYNITFDMTVGRLKMLKVGFSCIWHSILGTGYIHFDDIGCDALVKKVRELDKERRNQEIRDWRKEEAESGNI